MLRKSSGKLNSLLVFTVHTLRSHSCKLVWVCCASIHAYGCILFSGCMCACAHICLFFFVSSVNYLQHWLCLSIVDGNGKYVSLWLLFSGNSIQHLSVEKRKETLPRSRLITYVLLVYSSGGMWNTGNPALLQTHIPCLSEILGGVMICLGFDKWDGGQLNYCSKPTFQDL